MIDKNVGYGYNDLDLVPAVISKVSSRSQCDVFKDKMLPIFAAPMSTVVNVRNLKDFKEAHIMPVVPRNIDYDNRIAMLGKEWVSFSLREFGQLDITKFSEPLCICVDMANGHIEDVYRVIAGKKQIAIEHNIKLTVMTGNIANPETYKRIINMRIYGKDGISYPLVDYIRCSIGSGAGCLTASNTGVHYPIASLIDECNQIKQEFCTNNGGNGYTKIIADGGIKNYSDVIKALALGADYVMIGSLFASCIESAGDKYHKLSDGSMAYVAPQDIVYETTEGVTKKVTADLFTEFYGMASAKGQIDMLGEKKKTSEGRSKWIKVEYTLQQWSKNMQDYLKSAMSYCNCFNVYDFIGTQVLKVSSPAERNAINK